MIKLKYLIVFFSVFVVTFGMFFMDGKKVFGFSNMESNLIYYPMNRKIADIRLNVKTKFEDIYFYSFDGVKLNSWYIAPKEGMPTVIYCHGQGENISMWQGVAQFLSDNGYGVFMLEYRGHGRSSGSPFESGLYIDLESAINYLENKKGLTNDDIILWGRSLGGAVVADVASRDSFRGVVLESTFTNIRDAAEHITSTRIAEGKIRFWSCVSTKFIKCFPMTQNFQTERKINRITSPLLIACSVNDETIPYQMSLDLAGDNPHSELFVSKKGSHHSSEWVMPRVLKFLNSLQENKE